jgi:hypothetical protein
VIDPSWTPVILIGGAVLLKGTMGFLDNIGALERLPPAARPQVTAVFAGAAGVLLALAGGMPAQDALLVALGMGGVSNHIHATARGLRK